MSYDDSSNSYYVPTKSITFNNTADSIAILAATGYRGTPVFPYTPTDGLYFNNGDVIRITSTGYVRSSITEITTLTFDLFFDKADDAIGTADIEIPKASDTTPITVPLAFEFLITMQALDDDPEDPSFIASNGVIWTPDESVFLGPNLKPGAFKWNQDNTLEIEAAFDPSSVGGLTLFLDQLVVEYLPTPSGSG